MRTAAALAVTACTGPADGAGSSAGNVSPVKRLAVVTPAGTRPVSSAGWATTRDVKSLDAIFSYGYPENTADAVMCESLLRQINVVAVVLDNVNLGSVVAYELLADLGRNGFAGKVYRISDGDEEVRAGLAEYLLPGTAAAQADDKPTAIVWTGPPLGWVQIRFVFSKPARTVKSAAESHATGRGGCIFAQDRI